MFADHQIKRRSTTLASFLLHNDLLLIIYRKKINIMKKILIVLLFAGTYSATFAQQPGGVLSDKTGWHKIAETIVDFTRERDEVAILGADRFAAIKFRVTDAPIDFINAEIFYEKGDSQYVALRSPIAAPGETRAIDLKNGAERDLKKISFEVPLHFLDS